MIFRPTSIPGVVLVEPEPRSDERGHFARLFCKEAFAAAGHPFSVVQMSLSFNPRAGTLRGMHYQEAEGGEAKLVRCTRGRVFDVALDLRPWSPTYRRWTAAELDPDGGRMLLIPPGCAHGFLTLAPDTEVAYAMDRAHDPARDRGARWDDPAFGIAWPSAPALMSARDAAYPDHDPVPA